MIFTLSPPTRPAPTTAPILIGDIVINELMYDPISGNDDDQYIELYNQGTNTVNLSGWQFTSGVTLHFPSNVTHGARTATWWWRGTLTNLFAKYPESERGQHGGQLQRQTVAQRRAAGPVHAAKTLFWTPTRIITWRKTR